MTRTAALIGRRGIVGSTNRLIQFATALMLGITPVKLAADEVRDPAVAMQVVESVDLSRYLGRWYEIARFPNRFERDCANVTADYAMRADDRISVVNTCDKAGTLKAVEGQAWVVAPGKLKVTFVPWLGSLAAGDYWILHVEPDYSMAVVGAPDGGFGWILARDSKLPPAPMARALDVLGANGYDVSKLEQVQQDR